MPLLKKKNLDYNIFFFKVIKTELSLLLTMNPSVPSQCLSTLFNLQDEIVWPHFLHALSSLENLLSLVTLAGILERLLTLVSV